MREMEQGRKRSQREKESERDGAREKAFTERESVRERGGGGQSEWWIRQTSR